MIASKFPLNILVALEIFLCVLTKYYVAYAIKAILSVAVLNKAPPLKVILVSNHTISLINIIQNVCHIL